ncbi:uncharacterized protein LOC127716552 isoform X1 [Mytilus californianus]|uniref:uncharacterized protein LOC127716552 isoform X1 n=1 Tax=Mytilus californianus TaxID=6549 RepID=UPI0022456E61|nr:uncharacterized protein LOC127716552 isoform X1 [Mytilus californianus]
MIHKIALLLCFIYGINVFTVKSAPAFMGTCEDSGVMIASGEIDCKYLENPSAYNIHKNPERFCMQYQKECCITCTRIKQNGYYTTKSTAVSHTSTKALSPLSVQPTEACIDTGVWIDGLVECSYLERPSSYNIHKNPAGFCHKYFNECCVTCTKLKQKGYTAVESASIVPTVVYHTSAKASTPLLVQPTEACIDTEVWIGDGLVECSFLEQPSSYNIHKNPVGFCHKYFNECCATCTKLKQKGYTTVGSASIVPTVVSHTSAKASTPLSVRLTEACKDTGVWIGDGLVKCNYLKRQSSYNIHKNPAGFCQKYFNKCCATCSKLKQNGFMTLKYATENTTESTSTTEKPKSLKTTAYEHLKLPNFVIMIINFALKVISG